MPVAASRSPVPPPASPVPQRPVAPSLPEDVPIDLETDSFASEIPLEQRRPSAHDLRVLAAPEAALFSAPQAPRRRGRAVGAIAAAAVLVAGAAGAALYVNPGLLRPGSDTALASAAGAARSSAAADALWSPCLSAPLAASAAPREVACGAGKLAVDRKADGTRFALGGLPPASVAQELPAHVRAVLPNLGAPSTSFAQSCENAQPAMPAATAPTGERLAAFHAAMAGLRTCRLAGGRRSARWKLDGDQELEARTEYAADGGRVLLSFGPPTAVPSSWKPAPWKAGPFMEQPAAAPDALEAALVGAGFLPGDGAALRAAAKQLRLEDPTQTVVPLAALIKLVSGASDWMLLGKTKAYATCVGPALSRIGDTDPAMRFRLLAGVTPQGAALLAEPPRPNANAETLAQRFDAASGSALHFRCALDLGCQLLRGKVLGLKQLADGLDREHAAIAQVLLCDRRFAELALTEVGASRLKLVEQ